ncbi:hypothetical protein GGR57DRAFT_519895 [Xylariaceae sp. FL1272]|nr:hypothetical protein GGR57DRAFT_519895 [Xylariaceae sp. FL1272]
MSRDLADTGSAYARESLVPNLITCIAVAGVASIVFIGLRIWSRKITYGHLRFETSDWLLLVAWVFYALQAVALGIATEYGTGHHVQVITDPKSFHVWGLASEVVYFSALAFLKLSVLSFYGRIFPQRSFHYWLWAVSGLVVAWDIAFTLTTILQCVPVSYAWDQDQPGSCINIGIQQLLSGIVNIITDFIILALPIPLIWKLNIPKREKRRAAFTLAFGCAACLVSIVRLAFAQTIDLADGSWTGVRITYISIVETTVGILAVSIPTYKPLYVRLFGRPKRRSSDGGGDSNSSGLQKGSIPLSAQGSRNPHIRITHQIEQVRHANLGGAWVEVPDEDERWEHDASQNRDQRPSSIDRFLE